MKTNKKHETSQTVKENGLKRKIGIVGMGPVGQILAVHFKEAGCVVAVADLSKEKINTIRHKGIKLIGKMDKSSYVDEAYTSITELLRNKLDLLIFAVKTHHVDSLLIQAGDLCEGDYKILCAQNGIDAEQKFLPAFGESRILRMVVNFAGNLHAPNITHVTFFNAPNYVASIDDTQLIVAEWISKELTSTRLDTVQKDSFTITDKVWEKTILNASLSPLCGIAKLTIKEVMDLPDTQEIIEQTILEAVEVARAEEIKFDDNFVKLCMRYLRKAGDHFPSLAVDLLNNKETEIAYFNGKIVEYGRKHYIRTPLNLTFTNLVKAVSHKNNVLKTSEKPIVETILDI